MIDSGARKTSSSIAMYMCLSFDDGQPAGRVATRFPG
jgi:hypothetical protein